MILYQNISTFDSNHASKYW